MLRIVPRRRPDDDLVVVKSILPPPATVGNYASPLPPLGVPSLVWFCLVGIYHHPDQLHVLPYRLNYRNELNDLDLLNLDPRLWATLVQLYDNLSDKLSVYPTPLNDIHLPVLQRIPSTPRFSLITVIGASACTTLCDDNITDLKSLHSLTALDASNTPVTAYGIMALASTLQDESGPWPLRVLSLRNCKSITADVYPHLSRFPLLSVVDVRGTKCTASAPPPTGFRRSGQSLFFHTSTLQQILAHLHEVSPHIYSSSNVYTLLIHTLDHKPSKRGPRQPVHHDNTVVTFSSNRLHIGNADAIERRKQAREDQQRHEENKLAWYERHEGVDIPLPRAAPVMSTPLARRPPPSSSSTKRLPTRNADTVSWRSQDDRRRQETDGVTNSLPRAAPTMSSSLAQRPLASSTATRPAVAPPPQAFSSRMMTAPGSRQSVPLPLPQQPSRTAADPLSAPPRRSMPRPNMLPTNPRRSTATSTAPVPRLDSGLVSTPRPPINKREWTTDNSDDALMLYRDPPPWDALADAKRTRRLDEERRRAHVKDQRQLHSSDLAKVDLSGNKAVAVQQQIEGLVSRRTQMRADFGLPESVSALPKAATNPFKRRLSSMTPVATGPVSLSRVRSTPVSESVPISKVRSTPAPASDLVPISKVRTPVFTQELLDASKDKSIPPAAKKQRRSSLPAPKKPRISDGSSSGSSDLRKWFVAKK